MSQAAPVATLPSALFVERLSLGASWVYSFQRGDWTLAFLVSIRLLLIGAMLAFWMKPDEEPPGAALAVTLAAKEAKL